MTVRDDVDYMFDDPDDGWFGGSVSVEPEPEPLSYEAPVVAKDQFVAEDQFLGADDSVDTDSWYMPFADPNFGAFVDPAQQEDAVQQEGFVYQHDVVHEAPVLEDPAALSADPFEAGPFDEKQFNVNQFNANQFNANQFNANQFNYAPTRHDGFVAAPRPASMESRLSSSGAWDFKSPSTASRPWHRSKYAALVAVAAVAAALLGVVLLVRSPATPVEESTTVAPIASTKPAPSSSAPAISAQTPAPLPPPGPPLPPPPPPSAEQISPPAVNRQYSPSYRTPDAPKKPQLNVTRAPLSATPPPPPPPDRNSSTPGDSKRRHGFW